MATTFQMIADATEKAEASERSLFALVEVWETANPDAPRELFIGEAMWSAQNPFVSAYNAACTILHDLRSDPEGPGHSTYSGGLRNEQGYCISAHQQ